MKITTKLKMILILFSFLPMGIALGLLWEPQNSKFQFAAVITFFTAFVLCFILVHPAKYWIFLSQLNRIKAFCENVKKGEYQEELVLPKQIADSVEENEFLSLMRELNFMKHTIKSREVSLKTALAEIHKTQMQTQEELEMAKKIQNAIIPMNFRSTEKINVSGAYAPMANVGGDFYDLFHIGKNKLGIIMADVCGHGLPAALITMTVKIAFSNFSKLFHTTSEIVAHVNNELYHIIGNMEYFTAFFGILDLETGNFQYTNAGHPEILVIRKDNSVEKLKMNSPIIGFMENLEYLEDATHLRAGDRIALYTDGIIESRNDNDECYGQERLMELLIRHNTHLPKEMVSILLKDLDLFRRNSEPNDDISILIVDFYRELGNIMRA